MKSLKSTLIRAFGASFISLFRDWKVVPALVVGFALVSILSGTISEGFSSFVFGPDRWRGFLELFISISVLSAIFFFTYLSVSPTGFSLKENTPLPKKVLVIFLSPANGAVEQKVASLKEAKTVEELLNLVNSTQELRSWRMPLEAILHHRDRLEKVVVLASSLSAKQLDSFKKLVEVLQNLSKLKFSLQFQKVDTSSQLKR
jgi:hypothetical protein